MKTLTAENLKLTLWETLQDLRADKMAPDRADAIATQAREILRTVKLQMQIVGLSQTPVPAGMIDFVTDSAEIPTLPPSQPTGGARKASRPKRK